MKEKNLTGTGMKARLLLLEGYCRIEKMTGNKRRKEGGERLKYEERREGKRKLLTSNVK